MSEETGSNTLTIVQLEQYLHDRYQDSGTSDGLFIKLIEEIGEVAEVLNQLSERKKNPETNDLKVDLANELADVIHYTVAIAGLNHINLAQAIVEKDKKASVKYNQTPNLETVMTKTC